MDYPYLCRMRFESLIAQNAISKQLTEMVQHNRLSHALLFLGKEGTGALSLARAFAQYVVCEKVNAKTTDHRPQTTEGPSLFGETEHAESSDPGSGIRNRVSLNDSCGECAACKKAAALIHPDIHFSYPVITKKRASSQ